MGGGNPVTLGERNQKVKCLHTARAQPGSLSFRPPWYPSPFLYPLSHSGMAGNETLHRYQAFSAQDAVLVLIKYLSHVKTPVVTSAILTRTVSMTVAKPRTGGEEVASWKLRHHRIRDLLDADTSDISPPFASLVAHWGLHRSDYHFLSKLPGWCITKTVAYYHPQMHIQWGI